MKNITPMPDMPYGRRLVRLRVPEIEGLVVGKTFEANARFDILTTHGILANIPGEWLEEVTSASRKERKPRRPTANVVDLKTGKQGEPMSTRAPVIGAHPLKKRA